MPVSEKNLHPYIKFLVEEGGMLTTTELIRALRGMFTLDAQDKTLLAKRRDDKFSQTVRNVISHAPAGRSSRHGYIIDKTVHPAHFYAMTPGGAPVTDAEIKARKRRLRAFRAKKTDFDALRKKRTKLGNAGEKFALKWEKERLNALHVPFDVEAEVVHVSKLYGDGAGYDILSRLDGGYKPRQIEVKTTKGDADTPFYLSANEKNYLRINRDTAVIYRVYHFDPASETGEVAVLTYDDIRHGYLLSPIDYLVKKR